MEFYEWRRLGIVAASFDFQKILNFGVGEIFFFEGSGKKNVFTCRNPFGLGRAPGTLLGKSWQGPSRDWIGIGRNFGGCWVRRMGFVGRMWLV
jgi:hypothetical protein